MQLSSTFHPVVPAALYNFAMLKAILIWSYTLSNSFGGLEKLASHRIWNFSVWGTDSLFSVHVW